MKVISSLIEVPQSIPAYIYGSGMAAMYLHRLAKTVPGLEIAGFIDSSRAGCSHDLPIHMAKDILPILDKETPIILASQQRQSILEHLHAAKLKNVFYPTFALENRRYSSEMEYLFLSPNLDLMIRQSLAKRGVNGTVVLVGDEDILVAVKAAQDRRGGGPLVFMPADLVGMQTFRNPDPTACVVYCHIPATGENWQAYCTALAHSVAIPLLELLLPFTQLLQNMHRLEYYVRDFDEMLEILFGTIRRPEIEALDKIQPLVGKRVVEFGPADGYHTAAAIHLGAKSIDCVEARSENIIKQTVMKNVMGWDHVNLHMLDFHLADAQRFGRFDVAMAHGVLYHSLAPFLFLNNLVEMADSIFIGTFCCTDELPEGKYEILEHGGRTYRVKRTLEADRMVNGMNSWSYFLHKDDLQDFFRDRGFIVTVTSDEERNQVSGNYTRLVAVRQE